MTPKQRILLAVVLIIWIWLFAGILQSVGYEKSVGYPSLMGTLLWATAICIGGWIMVLTPDSFSDLVALGRAFAILGMAFPLLFSLVTTVAMGQEMLAMSASSSLGAFGLGLALLTCTIYIMVAAVIPIVKGRKTSGGQRKTN